MDDYVEGSVRLFPTWADAMKRMRALKRRMPNRAFSVVKCADQWAVFLETALKSIPCA